MGMHLQEDGILSVNDEKLRQTAAESGNDLSGFNILKEFSSSLLHKSDQVALNPMDYVDKKLWPTKIPVTICQSLHYQRLQRYDV